MPWLPDVPRRLEYLDAHLASLGWLGWEPREAAPAPESEIELVHDPAYVTRVKELAQFGGGAIEPDTWVGEGSYRAALHAAGAAAAMTRALLAGEARNGFCAIRPPGHHATRDAAMGFCLFNNVALAAEIAITELGLERVFILDWDAHHGNGTAEIFRRRADVLFASFHQGGGFYPGTGPAEDIGTGPGRGFSINLPVPSRSTEPTWLSLLDDVVIPAAAEFAPQLILISAGYDAHAEDPVTRCRLRTSSYGEMAGRVRALADSLDVPVGAVLEGGYVPAVLGDCVAVTMSALAARGPVPAEPVARDALRAPAARA